MKDITNPRLMWLKGGLLALLGLASATLLLIENPSWTAGLLLAVTIWAFCRAYYFAFYVIGRYVDPAYKFSGLGSFLVYVWRNKRKS